MARKKKHGAHENHERWLLTYADMITLLVAFFIMLYAMSVANKRKFEALAISVRSGFDGNTKFQAVALSPGTGIASSNALISPEHVNKPEIRPQNSDDYKKADRGMLGKEGDLTKPGVSTAGEERAMAKIKDKIQKAAAEHGLTGKVQFKETQRGLIVRILTDKLLFTSGQARLDPSYAWLIDVVGKALKPLPNDVSVEGHTDSLPIHTKDFPSNWELSSSRAITVLRYMADHDGIQTDRLCASGFADTRPIAPNTNSENRSRNRRVDIVILRYFTDNQSN